MINGDGQQLTFQRLSEAQFEKIKPEWDALHATSDQSVFTSWCWMYAWWQVFKEDDFELFLVECRSGERLVAILPFYIASRPFLKLLSLRTLYFLGCKGEGEAGYRAEYLDFVCSSRDAQTLCAPLMQYLLSGAGAGVDEIVLSDVPVSKLHGSVLTTVKKRGAAYIRETARDQTYRIDLMAGYDVFLNGLGKGTRTRIKGSEKRMVNESSFAVKHCSLDVPEALLGPIKELHALRWNNQKSFDAYQAFLEALLRIDTGGDLELSGVQLEHNEEVAAATLNLSYGGVVYNLMLGFKEVPVKRVSLGLLALGLDIQNCSAQSGLACYDLLAGSGKRSDYKSKIASKGPELVSHQILLSWLPRMVYGLYDRLRKTKKDAEASF
ncbi:hypothetical protein A3758_13990 [Oleiphilus sp. HI0118]|nr:hypothetical protein A3758_15810 [Oleiphilus sp. HI0118]KZZ46424.1 hypothetical protein A3758_13990 [Oleiphilus sp. HI0118]KZZ80521.1 hypothetical protein A3767_09820 [Oleiphilus sp. HI0133]